MSGSAFDIRLDRDELGEPAWLGELKASHTTLIEPEYMQPFLVDGPKRVGVPQLGMTISRLKEGYFISRILPGGSADLTRPQA